MLHVTFTVVTNCVASTFEEAHDDDILVVGIADGESNIITNYDTDYMLKPMASPVMSSMSFRMVSPVFL